MSVIVIFKRLGRSQQMHYYNLFEASGRARRFKIYVPDLQYYKI